MKNQNDFNPDESSCCSINEETKKKEPVCASGCNCSTSNSPSGLYNNIKYLVGAVVVLAALLFIIFQILKPNQDNKNQITDKNFISANQKTPASNANTLPTVTKPEINTPTKTTKQSDLKQYAIGEFLTSFNDLNTIAMDKDTVFVLISANNNTPVSPEIKKAIQEAVNTLSSNGVKAGTYTLSTSAPEYSEIVNQVNSLPFVVVSTKGKGTASVNGTITGDKLLQAYTSTIKTAPEGGCCPTSPGGCG
jgi:hypothetical protein